MNPETPFNTIPAWLRHWVETAPDHPCLLAPGAAPLSHSALWQRVVAIIALLRDHGITDTTRLAIALPQGREGAVAFLGAASCCIAVPLRDAPTPQACESQLEQLGVCALLTRPGEARHAEIAAQRLGLPMIDLAAASSDTLSVSAFTDNDPLPDAIALLLQTSGSSGRPKSVPLTHAAVCLSCRRAAQSLRLGPADVCLNMLALVHTHGLVSSLVMPLIAGGAVALTPTFEARQAPRWIDELKPTWLPASPAMHLALLEQVGRTPLVQPHRLRFLRSGGTALWPALVEELESTFGVPVLDAYGMTEAPQSTGDSVTPRRGSVGRALVQELAIIDEDGKRLPAGTTGQIVVRGPTVMTGYLDAPEANRDAFADGWFRTGDTGWLDQDGFLFLSGRNNEQINRGGDKLMPGEVDEVLLLHPMVSEAAAFAVPHPSLGQDLAAAVVLRQGLSADEQVLRRFVAARLPGYKVPSRILVVTEIPREFSGKVRRSNLAIALSAQLQPSRSSPQTGLEAKLAALFEEVLTQRLALEGPVGRDDNFFMLGGDSLAGVALITRLAAQGLGQHPPSLLFENPTIALLAKVLEEAAGSVQELIPIARLDRSRQR